MKTAYRLYHKPSNTSTYQLGAQGNTRQEAADTNGSLIAIPVEQWETTPSGSLLLTLDGEKWLIAEERVPESDADKVELALDLALEGGGIDGAHHKQWSLDQIVRVLTGDEYDTVIAEYRDGEDGPETYSWDEGVAP